MEKIGILFKWLFAPLDFVLKYFKIIVLLLIVAFIWQISENKKTQEEPNLVKLYLKGPIFESENLREQIEILKEHPNIKGALLIIDSPGGSIGASIEVANLIKELRDQIPVVAYVENIMASGSYYGGMYSDKIIANRGAIVGSIGVIFSGFNIKPLLDKVGIAEQTLQEGVYKSIGTPLREWKPREKYFLQALLKEQYEMFVSDVTQTRNLTNTDPRIFANGKIFSAKQALNLGLIDSIGSQNQAIKDLSEIAQIQTPIWLEKSTTQKWIDKISNASVLVLSNLLKSQIQ